MKIFKKPYNIGKYLFKAFFLVFIFFILYGAGLVITGLYLGDIGKAEKIVEHYNIFHKMIITLSSGFCIIFFGVVVKYLFNFLILEKENE